MPSNRNFGITFFIVSLILYFIFKDNNLYIDYILLALSFIFLSLGLINSFLLSPFNYIWYKFGLLLGAIVAPIVMAIIFYIIITPIGFIMKMIKKNYLDLNKDSEKDTYWIKRKESNFSFRDQF